MKVKDPDTREELKKRLRRIAGQVRGVEKMIDDDRDCRELLQQMTAIRAAVQQASHLVMHSYACQRLQEPGEGESQQDIVEDLISVVSKVH